MEKGEKHFIPFIFKSQKKKNKQLARSVGPPYKTRSKGPHLTCLYKMGQVFGKPEAKSLCEIPL
jgi:hypothetical protein